MILDPILWRIMLARDPMQILYRASLHVLENHEPTEAGVSAALHELWQARERVKAAVMLRILQTSTNQTQEAGCR